VHSFLLVFYSNFVPKMHRYLRYSTCMYTLTLKPGWGSLKVIENYTIQSGTRDFLLTFHSNHRPISHHFRDIHIAYFCIFFSRRFLGKFDTCCQRKVATCENIYIYRCTSTVPALNCCGRFFCSSLSAIYTKWCAQTFPQIYGPFAIFWPQFSKNCDAT